MKKKKHVCQTWRMFVKNDVFGWTIQLKNHYYSTALMILGINFRLQLQHQLCYALISITAFMVRKWRHFSKYWSTVGIHFFLSDKWHIFVQHDVISPNSGRRREFEFFNCWQITHVCRKWQILIKTRYVYQKIPVAAVIAWRISLITAWITVTAIIVLRIINVICVF